MLEIQIKVGSTQINESIHHCGQDKILFSIVFHLSANTVNSQIQALFCGKLMLRIVFNTFFKIFDHIVSAMTIERSE